MYLCTRCVCIHVQNVRLQEDTDDMVRFDRLEHNIVVVICKNTDFFCSILRCNDLIDFKWKVRNSKILGKYNPAMERARRWRLLAAAERTNKGTYRLRKPFACRRAARAGARCCCRTGAWARRWGRPGRRRRAPARGWCARTSRRAPPAWTRPRTACLELLPAPTSARPPPKARRRAGCLQGCSQHSWSSRTRGSGSRRWTGTCGPRHNDHLLSHTTHERLQCHCLWWQPAAAADIW